MSLFKKENSAVRFCAIIEIGSGSILVSIVKSDLSQPNPEIIWTKREQTVRRTTTDVAVDSKALLTTLMSAVLLLESNGRESLQQAYPNAHISEIQVSITAPWSFTITKVIAYNQEKAFKITEKLIDGLVDAANKKISEDLVEDNKAENLGLSVVARTTTDMQANDYKISDPVGKNATTLTLTQISSVAPIALTNNLNELKEKVFADTPMNKFSFMLMYHCVVRELYNQIDEYCLVDITYEATEIGIVRGGILKYCTHSPIGISTLARALAKVLNIPIEEAHSFLKEPNHTRAYETLPEEKVAEVSVIFDEYQKNVAALFKETGDTLSIPKMIFIHGGEQTEDFFARHIERAAKKATGSTHTVNHVTGDILTKKFSPDEKRALITKTSDTAMLIAALFFHKEHHCTDFIQV